MTPAQEASLRNRAGHLALAWHEDELGTFEGQSADEYATMILAAHIAADESRMSLHRWVDAGRRAGMSWAEIGALIGISKQAAHQRFGSRDEAIAAERDARVVRLGATAFNEMAILRAEGDQGNELVDTGMLQLIFRATPDRWAYRRVVSAGPSAALERAGWTYVSSWFVFHYYKRRIDG
jgi:hypothetical protein